MRVTHLRRIAWLLVLCFGSLAAADAPPSEVWVITDRQHPIINLSGARLIELDAPARIEAELAAQLPSNLEQAAVIARQRLIDGGPDLQRRVASAYQGVVDAWGLGITKIPAVVVNRRYVVYGHSDVAHALTLISNYRSKNP